MLSTFAQSIRKLKNCADIGLGILFLLIGSVSVGAEPATVRIFESEKIQNGKIAFVKPSAAKIIEMDLSGNTTWEYEIPQRYLRGTLSLSAGPDIEWIERTDSFLVVIPTVGAIEVARNGEILWEYLTSEISHDIDLLSDGTLVFVNGWDGEQDSVLTRINRSGEILEKYTAAQLGLDRTERRAPKTEEKFSNTHANAVQALSDGSFLLSLRNYHRAVVVKNGKITRSYRRVKTVHDPLDLSDQVLFAQHGKIGEHGVLQLDKRTGRRSFLFRVPNLSWTPLRTLEPLRNGNFLITGSTIIAQISREGEVVWQIDLLGFEHQLLGARRPRDFVYKAAFVYR